MENSRSAASSSLMRWAEPSRPSATRSSSCMPYRRPSGLESPDPSRSAAPASSSSGRSSRLAYSRPSTTAIPTATSATPPISSSARRMLPVTYESSALIGDREVAAR